MAKTVYKQDTVAFLKNTPLLLFTLFPASAIGKADDEISQCDNRATVVDLTKRDTIIIALILTPPSLLRTLATL